jgi:branched-chain amino acid aminotransferase
MGNEGYVTEAGAANFFAVIKNPKTGRPEAITCPLDMEVILPGVTRRSVIELLKQRDDIDVVERPFTISDIERAAQEGRLVEAFACGTAYFVVPAGQIRTSEGKIIEVPVEASSQSGKFAAFVKSSLSNIMWGKVSHPWAHVVTDESA